MSSFHVHNYLYILNERQKIKSLENITWSYLGKQNLHSIERYHSGGQHLSTFTGTKESVYTGKECNSSRIGLENHHFIVFDAT